MTDQCCAPGSAVRMAAHQAEPGDRQHALDSDLQIRGRQRAIVPAARVQNPGLQILASVPLDLDTGPPVASRRGRVMSSAFTRANSITCHLRVPVWRADGDDYECGATLKSLFSTTNKRTDVSPCDRRENMRNRLTAAHSEGMNTRHATLRQASSVNNDNQARPFKRLRRIRIYCAVGGPYCRAEEATSEPRTTAILQVRSSPRGSGGIGRRTSLRGWRSQERGGSSPPFRTSNQFRRRIRDSAGVS